MESKAWLESLGVLATDWVNGIMESRDGLSQAARPSGLESRYLGG